MYIWPTYILEVYFLYIFYIPQNENVLFAKCINLKYNCICFLHFLALLKRFLFIYILMVESENRGDLKISDACPYVSLTMSPSRVIFFKPNEVLQGLDAISQRLDEVPRGLDEVPHGLDEVPLGLMRYRGGLMRYHRA